MSAPSVLVEPQPQATDELVELVPQEDEQLPSLLVTGVLGGWHLRRRSSSLSRALAVSQMKPKATLLK